MTISTQNRGNPPSSRVVRMKVCLVGEQGVGKTSLIHRFVRGAFDEEYVRTLGAVASTKTVDLRETSAIPIRIEMMILDIMGMRTLMQLFQDAYFFGAHGVLAVFDLTRRGSLQDLVQWVQGVMKTVGPVPIIALGNKVDLAGQIEADDQEIEAILGPFNIRTVKTSAKTGENVEEAFVELAKSHAEAIEAIARPGH